MDEGFAAIFRRGAPTTDYRTMGFGAGAAVVPSRDQIARQLTSVARVGSTVKSPQSDIVLTLGPNLWCRNSITICLYLAFMKCCWRRGRDSNPRYPCEYFAFRVRRDRPLCHLSGAVAPYGEGRLLACVAGGRKHIALTQDEASFRALKGPGSRRSVRAGGQAMDASV